MPPLPNKRPSGQLRESHARNAAQQLLLRGTPLLDVRAPLEFAQGAVPNSTNLPILNDQERAQVGTTYKHSGSAAAAALGHKLVSGTVKAERIDAWLQFLTAHPSARILCWRGGQRSALAQQWLGTQGCDVERVPGGYKALRRACLETLDTAPGEGKRWWVVAGRTGVQKTVLIERLNNSINLEKLARHRGSAFGAHVEPQPYPASFENSLACAYLQHQQDVLVLEDESRTIGRLALPASWHVCMQQAPLVLLEASPQERVQHIVEEYVSEPLAAGEPAHALEQRYADSLQRISRRLGGVLYAEINSLLNAAFNGQGSHEAWVACLLEGYYDPMYDYQLSRKEERIRFRGSMRAVEDYLAELAQPQ